MKNNQYLLPLILCIVLLTACDSYNGKAVEEKITLGFCPTMSEHAEIIAESGISLKQFGSAAEVLENLRDGKISIAIIGRIAKESEVTEDIDKATLCDGLTLISGSKALIEGNDLKSLKVATYLSKDKIKDYEGDFGEVVILNSLDDAISQKSIGAVLIDWKDFKDDFELLIPMNEGKKIEKYRIPVLYFKIAYKNKAQEIISLLKTKRL